MQVRILLQGNTLIYEERYVRRCPANKDALHSVKCALYTAILNIMDMAEFVLFIDPKPGHGIGNRGFWIFLTIVGD